MKNEVMNLEELQLESFVTSMSIEEQAKQKGGTGAACGAVGAIIGARALEEFVNWMDEVTDGALSDAWDAADDFMGDLLGEDVWDMIKDFFEDIWEWLTY